MSQFSMIEKLLVDSLDCLWTTIENVPIPYLNNDGKKFVPVKILEDKILRKYSHLVNENFTVPHVTSHPITEIEAYILNTACAGQYTFSQSDLIVDLDEFLCFFRELSKFCAEQICGRVTGGWVQINNAVVPYVVKNAKRMAPLSIVQNAAGLLVNDIVHVQFPNDKERTYLNDLCKSAGLVFNFISTTSLFDLLILTTMKSNRPTILDLPTENPFSAAQFINVDDVSSQGLNAVVPNGVQSSNSICGNLIGARSQAIVPQSDAKDSPVQVETNSLQCEDKRDHMMPAPNLVMPARDPGMPAPNLVMPVRDSVMPAPNLVMPVRDPVMPAPNLVMPVRDAVMPAPNLVMPARDPGMPAPNLVMPVRDHVMPAPNLVMPVRDPVLPARDPVMPARYPVLPARDPVMPARDPVMPTRNPVIPARDPVLPARDPVLPARDPVLPAHQRETIPQKTDGTFDNSSVTLLSTSSNDVSKHHFSDNFNKLRNKFKNVKFKQFTKDTNSGSARAETSDNSEKIVTSTTHGDADYQHRIQRKRGATDNVGSHMVDSEQVQFVSVLGKDICCLKIGNEMYAPVAIVCRSFTPHCSMWLFSRVLNHFGAELLSLSEENTARFNEFFKLPSTHKWPCDKIIEVGAFERCYGAICEYFPSMKKKAKRDDPEQLASSAATSSPQPPVASTSALLNSSDDTSSHVAGNTTSTFLVNTSRLADTNKQSSWSVDASRNLVEPSRSNFTPTDNPGQ